MGGAYFYISKGWLGYPQNVSKTVSSLQELFKPEITIRTCLHVRQDFHHKLVQAFQSGSQVPFLICSEHAPQEAHNPINLVVVSSFSCPVSS